MLTQTQLLFLNREEAAAILGTSADDVVRLIRDFHALGVAQMVLTDGPAGAYASDGQMIWQLGIFAGEVVERTGAGDAFGVGFLGALLRGVTWSDALLWGAANSTSVVQHIGARAGLLEAAAVKKMISNNPAVKPKVYAKLK